MRARDIMQRDVKTVRPDATVHDVAQILAEANYSGLPVTDENGRLLGMVTEADLLARAQRVNVPTFFPFIGGIVYLESPRKFEEQLRKATAASVGDIMTTDIVTVGQDATVQDIAGLMVKRKINRLPVVDDEGLVGIVTRDDLIRAVHLGQGHGDGP